MRNVRRLIGLTLVFAAGTVLAGWWTVPLVAALWAMATPRDGTVRWAMVGAGIAWLLLLAADAALGPLMAVMQRVGGALGLAPLLLPLVTVAYAVLLAGTAAAVARRRPPGS